MKSDIILEQSFEGQLWQHKDCEVLAVRWFGFSVDVHSREFLKILNFDATDDQANHVTILSL